MNKLPFIVALLTAHAALGQVGYRSVENNQPSKKAYDSTVNVENIKCQFDPASMIGQEFYFAQRSPYFKGYAKQDTTFKDFFSDKQTTLQGLAGNPAREASRSGPSISYGGIPIAKIKLPAATAKKNNDVLSNLYKPIYIQYSSYSGEAVTPYSALENKTFTVTGWDILKEEEGLCQTQVTLKDADGEKVQWKIYGRRESGIAVFTKGYLEKLKQTWVNKPVYFVEESFAPTSFYNPLDKQTLDYVKGSKWQCTELTFLFDESFFGKLHLILRNDAQKEIAVQIDDRGSLDRQLSLFYIWSEGRYLAFKQKEKAEHDAALAKEEADKKQHQKDLKAYRQSMIEQFGTTNGNIIADGKVKMGMNQNMCAAAWGYPGDKVKTQVGAHVIETWFYYPAGSWLKFQDGKLVQIKE